MAAREEPPVGARVPIAAAQLSAQAIAARNAARMRAVETAPARAPPAPAAAQVRSAVGAPSKTAFAPPLRTETSKFAPMALQAGRVSPPLTARELAQANASRFYSAGARSALARGAEVSHPSNKQLPAAATGEASKLVALAPQPSQASPPLTAREIAQANAYRFYSTGAKSAFAKGTEASERGKQVAPEAGPAPAPQAQAAARATAPPTALTAPSRVRKREEAPVVEKQAERPKRVRRLPLPELAGTTQLLDEELSAKGLGPEDLGLPAKCTESAIVGFDLQPDADIIRVYVSNKDGTHWSESCYNSEDLYNSLKVSNKNPVTGIPFTSAQLERIYARYKVDRTVAKPGPPLELNPRPLQENATSLGVELAQKLLAEEDEKMARLLQQQQQPFGLLGEFGGGQYRSAEDEEMELARAISASEAAARATPSRGPGGGGGGAAPAAARPLLAPKNEDEELQRALALSRSTAGGGGAARPRRVAEKEDEELERALALSRGPGGGGGGAAPAAARPRRAAQKEDEELELALALSRAEAQAPRRPPAASRGLRSSPRSRAFVRR